MSNPNTIRDDITYIRQLAERGRRGPILGGTLLAAAGLVFGATCFVQWAGQVGALPIVGWSVLYLWLAAFAVFGVAWLVLIYRLKARLASASNASNAAFGLAWSACAVGILVSFAAVLTVSSVTRAPVVLLAYVPLIFAFYGVAWAVSAAMAKRSWMYMPAGISFAFTLVMAALAQHPLQLPAMGIALVVLLTVPGVRLALEETGP